MDHPKHMEFKYEFLPSEGSFFCGQSPVFFFFRFFFFFLTTINRIYFLEQF